MSIASEVQALVANKIAIKNAILAKSPATPPGDNLSDWPTSIGSIPSGGGGGGEGDSDKLIKFIDYDGTVLTSYTAAEALALTAMPALPSHEGLTCQGWNFTLEEMKARVNGVGICIVGPMYTTSDGKTKLKIKLYSPKFSSVTIVFKQTKANGVELDWGDGSEVETFSAANSNINATHEYSAPSFPATYTISLTPVSGTF